MRQGMTAHDILADIPAWNMMLARHEAAFAALAPGCSLGIVPQADATRRPGRMLVWERSRQDGMTAELRPYVGYAQCGVDILIIAENQGLAAIYGALAEQPLEELRAALRRGELCLFVMKHRDDLMEAGWEEFLETLGRAFMGLCR